MTAVPNNSVAVPEGLAPSFLHLNDELPAKAVPNDSVAVPEGLAPSFLHLNDELPSKSGA